MIVLKNLKWSNAFSYGPDNEIDFSKTPLIQLLGFNGHGKTSIALILEECLYNKNSKGIKKGDVLNRYVKDKAYTIELFFSKDGDEYHIYTKRGSTQSVKLTKNGEDISAHTSTGTYKLIEEIVGMDHKSFSQIVFQSSVGSLEFLTATDSTRKKFLIELLKLDKYTTAGEVFKAVAKQLDIEVAGLSGKLSSIKTWLDKNANVDLSYKDLVPATETPDAPKTLMEKVAAIKQQLATLQSDNKRIIQNNKYAELLSSIKIDPVGEKPSTNVTALITAKANHSKTSSDASAFIKKMSGLGNKCPTCLQDIDTHKVSELVQEQELIASTALKEVAALVRQIEKAQEEERAWTAKKAAIADYEQYTSLYDPSIPSELFDKQELESTLVSTEKEISNIEARIRDISKKNAEASAWNSKVDVIKEQKEEFNKEYQEISNSLSSVTERLSRINILVKTFSPSGLVAYKIECLVKDLEEATNEYLTEMSDGRFQISFEIAGNDKLNVVIVDNGNSIDIAALSRGENARVNIAALLGIRKLLQSLSNSRINLLFMDETLENLDVSGKENLVDILLRETGLNTILVSHGFQHPLLEKINVVKTNNISRIEQ